MSVFVKRVALAVTMIICCDQQGEASNSTAEKLSCSAISDHFCTQLWDTAHQGNFKTPDGEIRLGRSRKSNFINLATLDDHRALIAARKFLPLDLRNQSGVLLGQLEKILRDERETIEWARRYNRWDQLWLEKLGDIAQDRAMRKNPGLKKVRLSERTQLEQSMINREYYKLLDEITIAKYRQHPNWKRVTRLFEEIRQHLLQEVAQLPFATPIKDFLAKRIKAVELTLPLQDLDVFDGRKDCSESAINAYYNPSYNKITVCSGLFNSLRSDASTYLILAHELSHSIDPSSYNLAWLRENGARIRALKPLIGVKGIPIPCEEWANIVKQVESIQIEQVMAKRPYDGLALCFENNQSLKKAFDPSEIGRQIDEDMVEMLNYFSNRNLFSYMVIPSYREFGSDKRNPYFQNPEVFISEFTGKGYVSSNREIRDSPLGPEVFYQVIRCEYEKLKSPISFEKYFTIEGPLDRIQIFQKAILEAKRIFSLLFEEAYFACGQFCSSFVRKGMARNVDEKFADWMAFRIFYRFLESKKDIEDRRLFSAMAVANLCDRPSVRQEAGPLLNIEKNYSIEPHPENRVRRMSLYNKGISTLLQCEPEIQEAWGSCTIPQELK